MPTMRRIALFIASIVLASPTLVGSDTAPATPALQPAVSIEKDLAPKLLNPYLALQSALANDQLDAARRDLHEMLALAGKGSPLASLLHSMLDAPDIDGVRKPGFDHLSAAMIAAVKAHPDAFPDLLQMHCPMVYRDHGADWLQSAEPLHNPYFGFIMPDCGSVVGHVGGSK